MSILAVALAIILQLPQVDQRSKSGLHGCPDPIGISKSLQAIQRQDWRKVSADSVMSSWPGQLDELVCHSGTPCRLLVSKNRVIDGHCECCESFVFDIELDSAGSKQEHLKNIVIHYSSSGKVEMLGGAREFAQGAGVPSDKVAILGKDSVQRFAWTTDLGGAKYDNLAEVQIKRVGSNWEFYLSLTRDISSVAKTR